MASNSILPENDLQEEVEELFLKHIARSLSVQTEQTGKDLDNIISDNMKRAEEIQALK